MNDANPARPAFPSVIAKTLTPVSDAALAEAATIEAKAGEYQKHAHAANTHRAYRADWAHFAAWCDNFDATALPADPRLVARYLSAFAGNLSVATLSRRLSAIQFAHKAEGLDFDLRQRDLRDTWRGIRRMHGIAQRGKAPTVTEELRALVATLDAETPSGVRDRALLLLGFAGCFRRSELVALDFHHVAEHRDGVVVSLAWSKTDQEGAGSEKGIPYGAHPETCPVRALKDWVALAGITEGPLFRPVSRHGCIASNRLTDKGVARVVKRAVLAAQEAAIASGNHALADTFNPKRYAGHSLRAGFITSAAAAGVSTHDIMRQSGHTREETLRKYIRHATVFRQNAAAKVGL